MAGLVSCDEAELKIEWGNNGETLTVIANKVTLKSDGGRPVVSFKLSQAAREFLRDYANRYWVTPGKARVDYSPAVFDVKFGDILKDADGDAYLVVGNYPDSRKPKVYVAELHIVDDLTDYTLEVQAKKE